LKAGLEHIVVVAISGSQLEGRIHVEIGGRFPALMSATGRCLAAFGGFSQDELERQFHKIRWDRPPSLKGWWKDVESARRHRYSVDVGNYISGITIIAAPVFDKDSRMTHALVLVGVSQQIAKEGVARVAVDLKAAAATVSHGIQATAERS
jgi:DNA-binding IclR family transcriptional regulator